MRGGNLFSEQEIIPLNDLIRNHILHVYHVSGKNRKRTSELLGLSLSTLKRRLREMGIGMENGSS